MQGNGCPFCGCSGFDKTKPGILYYLKIITENNQTLYKIGITNRTVEEKFDIRELQRIEIIKQKLYEKGRMHMIGNRNYSKYTNNTNIKVLKY